MVRSGFEDEEENITNITLFDSLKPFVTPTEEHRKFAQTIALNEIC